MAECAKGVYRPRCPRETPFYRLVEEHHERFEHRQCFARHSVFKMLLRKGLLTPERIKLMKSWEHSGFNVNAAVRIRAPFSMNKIRYDTITQTVIYKTKMVERPNRNFEIFGPLVCPDFGGAEVRLVAANIATLHAIGGSSRDHNLAKH